ncbi:hypothetical protein C1I98_24305 [Spongiactinospora gelatinilytica]|uniref:Integral membrane protein n=1 Tax=Spongiactinospora gelatinilytica TaxID=2666298 RepID=A0A2W2HID7_9ACTN|nr:hypothetical protein [Spongiactinospora gelatinilytica]PZG38754.1 hypothetical protein C1I98_24305 [Spongiactinospora gelatinilytica]
MMTTDSANELKAAVAARRDLGPEYEDAIVEGFLEKVDQQIEERVRQRAAGLPTPPPADQSKRGDGQVLALAIVSLGVGMIGTITTAVNDADMGLSFMLWLGVVAVNVAFMLSRRRS